MLEIESFEVFDLFNVDFNTKILGWLLLIFIELGRKVELLDTLSDSFHLRSLRNLTLGPLDVKKISSSNLVPIENTFNIEVFEILIVILPEIGLPCFI